MTLNQHLTHSICMNQVCDFGTAEIPQLDTNAQIGTWGAGATAVPPGWVKDKKKIFWEQGTSV